MAQLLEESKIDATPHANTMTEAGDAVFGEISHAVAELVDNSIEAMQIGQPGLFHRGIGQVEIILSLAGDQKYLAVVDNGCGMNREVLEEFGRYAYNKKARGWAAQDVDGRHGSDISRYGVGAKSAGFYLGERILVMTSQENENFAHELVLDAAQMQSHAKSQDWAQQYKFTRSQRTLGAPLQSGIRVAEEVAQRETPSTSYTAVIVALKRRHVLKLLADAGMGMAHDLAWIFYYYLYPEKRAFSRREGLREGRSRGQDSLRRLEAIYRFEGDGATQQVQLRDLDHNVEALSWTRSLSNHFNFSLEFQNPRWLEDPEHARKNGLPERIRAYGILHYYPFDGTTESRPGKHGPKTLENYVSGTEPRGYKEDDGIIVIEDESDEEDFDNRAPGRRRALGRARDTSSSHAGRGAFAVFWSGRLLPKCTVNDLFFIPDDDRQSRKRFGMRWRARLGGSLFFDYAFDPQSNKLDLNLRGFQGTLTDFLDPQRNTRGSVVADPSNAMVRREFRKWLKDCHESDKDCRFKIRLRPLETDRQDWSYFEEVIFGSTGPTFTKGEKIRFKHANTLCYGKILSVILKEELPKDQNVAEASDGEIEVQLFPEKLYGDAVVQVLKADVLMVGSRGGQGCKCSDADFQKGVAEAGRALPSELVVKVDDARHSELTTMASSKSVRILAGEEGQALSNVVVFVRNYFGGTMTDLCSAFKKRKISVLAYAVNRSVGEDKANREKIFGPVTETEDFGGQQGYRFPKITFPYSGTWELEFIAGEKKPGKKKRRDAVVGELIKSETPYVFKVKSMPEKLSATWDAEARVFNGASLPPMSVAVLDAHESLCEVDDVALTLTAEGASVLPSEPRKHSFDGEGPVTVGGYTIVKERMQGQDAEYLSEPLVLRISASIPGTAASSAVELEFTLQCMLRSGSIHRLALAGVADDRGDVRSLVKKECIEVENKSFMPDLVLEALDEHGFPTKPQEKKVEWFIVVTGGACKESAPDTYNAVTDGQCVLSTLMCDAEEATEPTVHEVTFELRQADDKALKQFRKQRKHAKKKQKRVSVDTLGEKICELSIPVKVKPSTRATSICLRIEGRDWLPGEAGVQLLTAGEKVTGAVLVVFDGSRREIPLTPEVLGSGGVWIETEGESNRVRQRRSELPVLADIDVGTKNAGEEATFAVRLKSDEWDLQAEFHVKIQAGPPVAWYVAPPGFTDGDFTPFYARDHPVERYLVRDVRPLSADPNSLESLWSAVPAVWPIDANGNKAFLDQDLVNDAPVNGDEGCPILDFEGRDVEWGFLESEGSQITQKMTSHPMELLGFQGGSEMLLHIEIKYDSATYEYLCILDGPKQTLKATIRGANLKPCELQLNLLGGRPHHFAIRCESIGYDSLVEDVPPLTDLPPNTVLDGLELVLCDKRGSVADYPGLGSHFVVAIDMGASDLTQPKTLKIDGSCVDKTVQTLTLVESGEISFTLRRKGRSKSRVGIPKFDEEVPRLIIPYTIKSVNRVVSMRLVTQGSEDEETTLRLGKQGYPNLFLTFQTDGDEPFVPDPSHVFLDLAIETRTRTKKNSKRRRNSFDSSQTHDRSEKESGGVVFYGRSPEPEANPSVQSIGLRTGVYEYTARFREYRENVTKSTGSVETASNTLTIRVLPGLPEVIEVDAGSQITGLTAQCHPGATEKQRLLVKQLRLQLKDFAGNVIAPTEYEVTAEVALQEGSTISSQETLPSLAGIHGDRAKFLQGDKIPGEKCFEFRSLSLHDGPGYAAGAFDLLFSIIDSDGRTLKKSGSSAPLCLRTPFTAVASDGRSEEYLRLKTRREEYREALVQLEQTIEQAEGDVRRAQEDLQHILNDLAAEDRAWIRSRMRSGGGGGDMSSQDQELPAGLVTRILLDELTVENGNERQQIEAQRQASQRREPRSRPISAARFSPRGRVVDLGFVEDELDARLIAWAIGKNMGAVVFESSEEMTQFYKAEQRRTRGPKERTTAIEICKQYTIQDRDRRSRRCRTAKEKELGRLPIPAPRTARGFIDYAINMITLKKEDEDLRDTLFWTFLQSSMVFDTLQNALQYRKENRNTTPSIYCRDGNCSRNNAVLDPSDVLPTNPTYLFGTPEQTWDASWRQVERRSEVMLRLSECFAELERQRRLAEQRFGTNSDASDLQLAGSLAELQERLRKTRTKHREIELEMDQYTQHGQDPGRTDRIVKKRRGLLTSDQDGTPKRARR